MSPTAIVQCSGHAWSRPSPRWRAGAVSPSTSGRPPRSCMARRSRSERRRGARPAPPSASATPPAGCSASARSRRTGAGSTPSESSMRIVRGLESYPPEADPSVVVLGAFDGIHLGHRAILGTAVAQARLYGLQALACTFDPHPLEVLQPERSPVPITTLEERLEPIAEAGIDTALVVPFNPAVPLVGPGGLVRRRVLV